MARPRFAPSVSPAVGGHGGFLSEGVRVALSDAAVDRRSFVTGCVAACSLVVPRRALADPLSTRALEAAARYSAHKRGVSLLVMHDAKLVFEDYPNEGATDRAWETASGTKSFCGILAAAGVADGWLSLDEPCAGTLNEWARDEHRRQITVRHLLTLTSGIVGGGIGRPDTYRASVDAARVHAAGERFQYGPAPFQIFGEIVRRKLAAQGRHRDPAAYLRSRVLDAISATPTRWHTGADDLPLLPSGVAMTARAWANFGQFVLDGGRGQLDGGALAACFEGTRANPGYGLTWWLLRPGLVGPGPRAGVDGNVGQALEDEDVVMAAGAGDQRLYLLRRRRLVVVRQASGVLAALTGRGTGWQDADFLKTLLSS